MVTSHETSRATTLIHRLPGTVTRPPRSGVKCWGFAADEVWSWARSRLGVWRQLEIHAGDN